MVFFLNKRWNNTEILLKIYMLTKSQKGMEGICVPRHTDKQLRGEILFIYQGVETRVKTGVNGAIASNVEKCVREG